MYSSGSVIIKYLMTPHIHLRPKPLFLQTQHAPDTSQLYTQPWCSYVPFIIFPVGKLKWSFVAYLWLIKEVFAELLPGARCWAGHWVTNSLNPRSLGMVWWGNRYQSNIHKPIVYICAKYFKREFKGWDTRLDWRETVTFKLRFEGLLGFTW